VDIKTVPINSLVADPSNARRHDPKNIEAIKGSLKRFGQRKNIVVDQKGVVRAGNGTLEAARQLGWTEITVSVMDGSETELSAFAVADNRTSELADWDNAVLGETLDSLRLDGFDLEEIGFTAEDLDGLGFKFKDDTTATGGDGAADDEPADGADDMPADIPARCKAGETWKLGRHQLFVGDAKAMITGLLPNTVDAVVTDPPYGLEFMGKKWDYDVPGVEFWQAVFGAVKPGAHVLSFGGTRTYHRMAVNVEDGGFDIRDQLQWLYGSGFPKSLDISKAIDKAAGVERDLVERKTFDGRSVGKHDQNLKGWKNSSNNDLTRDNTAVTDIAKAWDGWGTALKPANEPIVLARKPISEKTVADNVLKWGCGGINVDGGRIGFQSDKDRRSSEIRHTLEQKQHNTYSELKYRDGYKDDWNDSEKRTGRFPANVILDETAAAMLDKQSGELGKSAGGQSGVKGSNIYKHGATDKNNTVGCGFGDTGGASRFFMVINDACGLDKTKGGDTFAGKKTASKSECLSTGGFGNRQMALFQMGTISITQMETHSIIAFPILSVSTSTLIGHCTIDCEKIIKPLTVESIEGVSLVSNTDCLIYLVGENQAPIKGIVKIVAASICENGENPTEKSTTPITGNTATRFLYQAKASRSERGESNVHATVKPIKLMEYLCKLITPPGGTILEPFAGSGTTLLAAERLEFTCIAAELEPAHCDIILARYEALSGNKAVLQEN